jgi:hypothetical protein
LSRCGGGEHGTLIHPGVRRECWWSIEAGHVAEPGEFRLLFGSDPTEFVLLQIAEFRGEALGVELQGGDQPGSGRAGGGLLNRERQDLLVEEREGRETSRVIWA